MRFQHASTLYTAHVFRFLRTAGAERGPSGATTSEPAPASLELPVLAERLRALAGEERAVQVAFLHHLDALDQRRGHAELGYPSLWAFCLEALHLSEGAAARRIAAMRVLRRHPSLGEALREGRLSLSTLRALEPVLTDESLGDVLARASFRGVREVEALVASMRPAPAPADGFRRSAATSQPAPTLASLFPVAAPTASPEPMRPAGTAEAPQLCLAPAAAPDGAEAAGRDEGAAPQTDASPVLTDGRAFSGPSTATPLSPAGSSPGPSGSRSGAPGSPSVSTGPAAASIGVHAALAEVCWSLRVTLDAEARADLEALTSLLSHRVPKGDLSAVLKLALRTAVTAERKRRACELRSREASTGGPKRHRTKGSRAADGETPAPAASAPAASTTAASATALSPAGGGRPIGGASECLAAEVGPAVPARKAAQEPARSTARKQARPPVPAAVRREVWERDGGRCTFTGPGGRRCGSRWKLELDHVVPFARGGDFTTGNLTLRCREHNLFHAQACFGREHMARFRRRTDEPAKVAPGRHLDAGAPKAAAVPLAREAAG